MITATVTRPTTIAPTMTKQLKLRNFQDLIDVENMYTPKSRVISLEPVSKRGKMKKVKPATSASTPEASIRCQLTRHNTETATQPQVDEYMHNPPLSPAPSEDTIASRTSTSTRSYQFMDHDSPSAKPSPQTSADSTSSSSGRTITATTELLRHGALAGDTVPIKISVAHTKPNARGVVIATLYRLCRVDMHPNIPLTTKTKKAQPEYEDIYPRSRTGLGGLYFTAGAPTNLFRMDLSQTSTMLVVDPRTLTSDIKTSIKVPDETFPTIANVPGGMISFTYHIEVVIDLCGKLGETRLLPRLTSSELTFTRAVEIGNQLTSDWANNILDTTALRRTKSVATFEFAFTVGTKDTSRNKRSDQSEQTFSDELTYNDADWPSDAPHETSYEGHHYYDEEGYSYESYEHYLWWQAEYGQSTTAIIPPPEPQDEVDEKTRLQRHEELLMPSQPPQEGESSTMGSALTPSAPPASAVVPQVNRHVHFSGHTTPLGHAVAASGASARSAETVVPSPPATPPPSLPSLTGSGFSPPSDDKHELERQRLMAQASSPPLDDPGPSSSNYTAAAIPSAPIIRDEEEYIIRTLHDDDHSEATEHPPQYQR